MDLFGIQILNGITLGMLYGMAALGFTMVYKALGYLNFSHCVTITMGALIVYTIITSCNIPYVAAIPIVLFIMLLYGFGIEKLLFKRFRKASSLTFMLVSISLSTVLVNICQLIFGAQPRGLSNCFPNWSLNFLGILIPMNKICIFLIAVIMLFILQAVFMNTKFGLSLRLASEDPSTASMMGVNIFTTRAATFSITACLGGLAGMLLAPLYSVTIDLGSKLALKIFIAAVIGGLGNFVGSIAGGLLVGIVEALSSAYISSSYKDLIVYVAGIIVLAIFPYGIFRRVKTRV
jgi:branched-chain amino acid transport system permease protein